MKTNLMLKSLSYFTFMALLFLASCQDDKIDFSSNDSQNVENEAVSDAYYEDADDMSGIAVSSDATTLNGARESENGRKFTVKISDLAKRFDCATITFETAAESSPQTPKGTITVDFGTGCTDSKGNVRKGKIIINYTGRRFLNGSSVVTTFADYFINGVKIEGTRTVTNTSASLESNPVFEIKVNGGKATWPDATFATREVNRTREWNRGVILDFADDQWIVTGTASGTNRNGRAYQMEITKPLVYKRECAISDKVFIAVEGTKVLTVDSKQVTIDYGTGACDKLVTITVNGKSREVEVRGDI
jgi:hypothetical protein